MLEETKIVYYIGDEKTPYVRKINISPEAITLGDFKAAIEKPNYKFFFRSNDQDFGVVKEEINNDDSHLPVSENRIVAWLVPPDVDVGSQNSTLASQISPMHSHHPTPMSNGIGMGNGVETESIASSHKGRQPRYNRHMMYDQYGSQSTLMSSDLCSTTSWDSGDATSEYSTCTEMTASSRYRRPKRHRYKKKRPQPGSDTTSVYSSSITDSSLSLNILGVTLNMEKHNFLGISIVGQSNDKGDGGIYIGSIMKGGAVAADGRIEPGDMLLQVNEVNFENMSNEDAVRELRNIVHKPGPITLTVAKCWDPSPESNYFSIPEDEPIRPIDPATWATHINAVQGNLQGSTPPYITASSDTLSSSLPESERYEQPLSIHTDMAVVMKSLKSQKSGIEVKTRMWLKITIPDAFIGSDLVDWLNQKVEGLEERRDARKYASSLLKVGYIRHTVNKATFSEQCYYVFGDYTGNNLHQGMAALSLGDSNSDRDSDTLGPLPTHGGSTSWGMPLGASNHGYSSFSQYNPYPQASGLTVGPRIGVDGSANMGIGQPSYPGHQSDADTVSLHSAHGLAHRSASQSSLPQHQLCSFGGSGGSGSDQASESRFSVRSSRSGAGFSAEKPRSRSGSERSAITSRSGVLVQQSGIPFEGPLPPHPGQRPSSRNQQIQRPHNMVPQDMGYNYHTSQQTAQNAPDSFVNPT